MPYNGSGVFQRLYSFVTDRNNGIKVRADRMDAEMDGIATGLSNSITKDGQTTITANIPFNDKRITGLGDATSDADALNRRTGDARYLELDGSGTMTGVMRAADGAASAPAYSFGADLNSGFYRAGADDVRGAVNGADVFRMKTAGVDVTGAMAATGAVSGTTGTFSGAITMQSRAVDAFPAGTKLLFQQTNAPTGWTKDTTHNDKALRVVSGTAGSGGSTGFTTVFAARTIAQANLPNVTLSFSATTSSNGDHAHNFTSPPGVFGVATGSTNAPRGDNFTGTTSTNGAHAHTVSGNTSSINGGVSQTTMDFAVAYLDVIVATKD